MPMTTLEDLGQRICILGPSNSGKSTLAAAILRARALKPVVHLDQLGFLPPDWIPRPADEFNTLHDAAIAGSHWIIEGNFAQLLPQRLERATGVILLDVPVSLSLYRYLRRCWYQSGRIGALDSASDTVNWDMLHWITIGARASGSTLRQMYDESSLPKVRLDNTSAIAEFYHVNGLSL